MPSLSSFVSSNQYTKENLTLSLVAGMKTGTAYTAPVFNGINKAASNDPGGLFGWLIYARTAFSPAKGLTTDSYIVYQTPSDLVQDLNRLSGVTYCLSSATGAGGTYGFFEYNNTALTALEPGIDFIHAINYMAYGGSLVLVGKVSGFDSYKGSNAANVIDIVIDRKVDPAVVQWLSTQEYTTGVFPTLPDSTVGISGSGYTMANFGELLNNNALVTGGTFGPKCFNLYGLKNVSNLNTSTVQPNTTISYTIPAVSDVGGFFGRAKNRNELYLTIAGLDRSTVLNGDISNPIDWSNTLKNILRTNRVNFFVNYDPKFLGSDLVGATSTSADVTVGERIGPAKMKSAITYQINRIAMKYMFDINNQTTRNQVVTEVETALEPFAPFLDTTQTQIICNADNNEDNSSTLKIDVIAKPILGTESFVINVSYTQ